MLSRCDDIFPLATALRRSLKQGYAVQDVGKDASAALVVSLVALPLSMALAIAVGLPPQHGLYTAIVAGIIAALAGGSRVQVSGPTAAFVVILAPIVAEHGLRGLILANIMAGLMLLAMALARFGRLIAYVPYPVTTGFTAGIALVLATLSLNDLLGLNAALPAEGFLTKAGVLAHHLPQLRWQDALVSLVTLLGLTLWPKITRKLPSTIIGVGLGVGVSLLLGQYGHEVATIASRFSYTTPEGALMHGLPPYPPSLHWFGGDGLFAWPSLKELAPLVQPALVIAALAALESLLSATVADSMTGQRHHPNGELVGIGLANLGSAFAAGIPATGAIARTATNIRSGAVSPMASILHAGLILLYMWLFAPWMGHIPMASLAALLLVTAWHMSHLGQCLAVLRIAPRSDSIVLLTCFGLTVLVDMVAGVTVGLVLAAFLFMKQIADLTQVVVLGKEEPASDDEPAHRPTHAVPEDVLVYTIEGPLFFGSAEKAFNRSIDLRHGIRTLVLDLTAVPVIDMSGVVAMESLIANEHKRGLHIILAGSDRVTRRILEKLPQNLRPHISHTRHLREALAMEGIQQPKVKKLTKSAYNPPQH